MRLSEPHSTMIAATVLVAALLACKSGDSGASSDTEQASGTQETASNDATSASAASAGKVFGVGEKAALPGLTVWVDQVRDCKYDRESSQKSLERKEERFIGALVYFEGTPDDGEVRTSNSRWKAFDGEGITYNRQMPHGTDCTPLLDSSRLERGDKKKGFIGFRVPNTTRKLTVKYDHQPPTTGGKKPPEQEVTFQLL